jgi:hypothetical protein
MLTDELFRLVASQPEIRETRDVRVMGPALRAEVLTKGMRLSELLVHPDYTVERRTFRYAHLVGPPLTADHIDAWQSRFPEHRLPADVVAFLGRGDGVHWWADLDKGRAYVGLAPLAEWADAAAKIAGYFDEPPQGKLVISYHTNGDWYLVLDTATSTYSHIDHEIGETTIVATTFGELLDWLWTEAQADKPTGSEGG